MLNNISLDQIHDVEIQKMVIIWYKKHNNLALNMSYKKINKYISKAKLNTPYAEFKKFHYLYDIYNNYVYISNEYAGEYYNITL